MRSEDGVKTTLAWQDEVGIRFTEREANGVWGTWKQRGGCSQPVRSEVFSQCSDLKQKHFYNVVENTVTYTALSKRWVTAVNNPGQKPALLLLCQQIGHCYTNGRPERPPCSDLFFLTHCDLKPVCVKGLADSNLSCGIKERTWSSIIQQQISSEINAILSHENLAGSLWGLQSRKPSPQQCILN